MISARRLRPVLTASVRFSLYGFLAVGLLTAHGAQAESPVWHHFLHGLVLNQPASASPPTPKATTPAQPGPASSTSPAPSNAPESGPHHDSDHNAGHDSQHAPTTEQPLTAPKLPPLVLSNEDKQAQLTLFTALNFMLPRLLTPQSPQQLCLWGMVALLDDPLPSDRPTPLAHHASPHQAGHQAAQQPLPPLPQLSLTFQPGNAPAQGTSSPSTAEQPGPPNRLVLLEDNQPLLSEPLPNSKDITGWSLLSTHLIATLHRNIPRFQITSDEALLARFLNGLLARLDPYSRYLPPPPPPSLSDQLDEHAPAEPEDGSIGLSLRQSHSRFPIVGAINLASPLWDAGIIPGDSLISLNNHSTRNTSLPQLQEALNGPPGSIVRLGFRMQDGHYLTRDFTRNVMAEESVFPDHAGPHVILRVTHFSSHTAEEISQYLSVLLPPPGGEDLPSTSKTAPLPAHEPAQGPSSPSGLILDLRGNRGGMLQQAIMTAALFLDQGVIATTEGRASEANHVWSIQGGDLTDNTPLALLVDKDTGSAAEVLAAALADHQRADIIGSSSFGKGMVQVSAIMPNGGRLSLTWAHITAPQGWALQGLGVIPQLCTAPHGQFPLKAQLAALREGHSLMAPTLQQAHLVHEDTPSGTRLALREVCPPSPANPFDLSAALTLFATPQLYQAALLAPSAPSTHPDNARLAAAQMPPSVQTSNPAQPSRPVKPAPPSASPHPPIAHEPALPPLK